MEPQSDEQKELDNLERISIEYRDVNDERKLDQMIYSRAVKKFSSMIPQSEPILEMGYGDGIWTEELVEKANVDIVDASKTLLKKAKDAHGDKVNTFHSLFESFVPTRKYSTILMAHILEHVDDPVIIMSRAREWLKHEGRIFILVPNATSIHRVLGVCMKLQKECDERGELDREIGHRRVYSVKFLEEHVGKSGLEVVHKEGFFIKVLPYSLMKYLPSDKMDAIVDGFVEMGSRYRLEDCARIFMICKAKV